MVPWPKSRKMMRSLPKTDNIHLSKVSKVPFTYGLGIWVEAKQCVKLRGKTSEQRSSKSRPLQRSSTHQWRVPDTAKNAQQPLG